MSEKSAWLMIWTKPRETIRQIISENPRQCLWRLATIYGFGSILGMFQSFSIGGQTGPGFLLLFTLIFAPFWGYLVFLVWNGIVTWTGRLFKGNGDFQNIRAAYAWSCVPLIGNCLIWIVMVLLFGSVLFTPGGVVYQNFSHAMGILLFIFLFGKVILSIWSLVIYLNALAEVQQFSILRAIGNVVVSGIFFAIMFGVFMGIAVYLIGLGAQEVQAATTTIQAI